MVITQIKKINQKYRIYIDEEYMFPLYFTELKKYNIQIGNCIDLDTINNINKSIIKRGTNYIYNLLSKKDYTYKEFQNKLIQAGYKENQISTILFNFLDNGYINDKKYAKRYLDQMKKQKSIAEMVFILKNKGIDKSIIKDSIEELEIDEYKAAEKILKKRLKTNPIITYKDKIKNYNYLLNKGYKADTIRKLFQFID